MMTIRDEFVKSAMQGLLSNGAWIDDETKQESEKLEFLYVLSTGIADYFMDKMKEDALIKIQEADTMLRSMRSPKDE